MIRSFADKRSAAIFAGYAAKGVAQEVASRARVKMLLIDAAATLDFLRSPPGNRLEMLRGNRAGQYSIRINDQWRVCFVWEDGNAFEVEFCDYHYRIRDDRHT